MARYFGEVRDNADDDTYPFIVIITDENCDLVGEFPVRTRADGEAKIVDALKELRSGLEEPEA